MNSSRCDKCKKFVYDFSGFGFPHICQLKWEVTEYEDFNWFKVIYADLEEDAVEQFCAYQDESSAEYYIIGGGGAECIYIRASEDSPVKKYSVEAYSQPTYFATEIK